MKLIGADQSPTHTAGEPNPAYTGAILTASTTPAGLYGWFGARLDARGYRSTTAYPLADQSSGMAWEEHHRVQFQVEVFVPDLLRADTGLDVRLRPGQLVYEQVLVGYERGLPKD